MQEGGEDPMQQVLGCSVSYRIAVGIQQGRKVFTLQTLAYWEADDRFNLHQVAQVTGFGLHAFAVVALTKPTAALSTDVRGEFCVGSGHDRSR